MLTQLNKRLLLESDIFKEKKKYWNEKLSGYTLSTRKNAEQSNICCKKITFDSDLQEKLLRMSEGSDLSLYTILLSFLNITIYKFFNEEDIVIASPIYKEIAYIHELNNVVLIRSNPNESDQVLDFQKTLKEVVKEAYVNQEYPIYSLFSDEMDGESVFVDFACSLSAIHETFPANFHAGIHISFEKTDDELTIYTNYSSILYEDYVIDRFIQSFYYLISALVPNMHIPIGKLSIVPKENEKEIMTLSQSSEKEFVEDHIVSLFEKVVVQNPELEAVWYEGNSISYRELDIKSDQVANKIIEKRVSKGSIIGLYMDRGIETIIGILGILKAGAAYLPLDLSLPLQRIKYMLTNSKVKILLTCGQKPENLDIEVIDLQDEQLYMSTHQKPEAMIHKNDLAYVIYTSGSTGNPKGVMIEHKSVTNLVKGLFQRIYSSYSQRKVAVIAPFYFDASVKQIFASLLLGHTLYIVPEYTRKNGLLLLLYYQKNQIHISDGTPMHLQMFLVSPSSKCKGLSLQHLIIGGEVLTQKTVNQLMQKFGPNPPRITNVYGPTECCVDTTSYEIELNDIVHGKEHILIGRPLVNYNLYILDRSLLLCPVGAIGEICVSGDGVARGYMGLPELTKEKFINHPFEPKTVLYRTGDLGRWLPDGNIEYIGRRDHQVKIKGHRIELGEIERALLKHPDLTSVTVVCNKIKDQDELIAYFVSNVTIGTDQCRDFLANLLPEYMIPKHYLRLEKFPLNKNGKVDRKQLPTLVTLLGLAE